MRTVSSKIKQPKSFSAFFLPSSQMSRLHISAETVCMSIKLVFQGSLFLWSKNNLPSFVSLLNALFKKSAARYKLHGNSLSLYHLCPQLAHLTVLQTDFLISDVTVNFHYDLASARLIHICRWGRCLIKKFSNHKHSEEM